MGTAAIGLTKLLKKSKTCSVGSSGGGGGSGFLAGTTAADEPTRRSAAAVRSSVPRRPASTPWAAAGSACRLCRRRRSRAGARARAHARTLRDDATRTAITVVQSRTAARRRGSAVRTCLRRRQRRRTTHVPPRFAGRPQTRECLVCVWCRRRVIRIRRSRPGEEVRRLVSLSRTVIQPPPPDTVVCVRKAPSRAYLSVEFH